MKPCMKEWSALTVTYEDMILRIILYRNFTQFYCFLSLQIQSNVNSADKDEANFTSFVELLIQRGHVMNTASTPLSTEPSIEVWGTGLFNPFPNKIWFLGVCSTSLLKTLLEKEKLLATSNFSFSHGFKNFLPFSSNLKLSSANSFSLEKSVICRLGKG